MRWQRFLDSLNTAGGHILLLALGVGVSVLLLHWGLPDGRVVLAGAGGALLMLLRGTTPVR